VVDSGRKYSSTDEVFTPDPATATIPLYWYRPLTALSAAAGMHRFTWDMHYQPLDGGGKIGGPNLPIAAIGRNTIAAPTTPWVNPGQFTAKLTVNGKSYSKPIVVKADPRVKTPALAMQQVYALSKSLYYGALDAQARVRQARDIRDQIAATRARADGAIADALASLDKRLETLVGESGALAGVMNILQGADVPPTSVQLKAITAARATAAASAVSWTAIRTVDVPALNVKLTAAGLSPVTF